MAFTDIGRDAFSVGAALRTLRDAPGRVEDEAWFAFADTWRDAVAVGATGRTTGDAGLPVTRRINEPINEQRICSHCSWELIFG